MAQHRTPAESRAAAVRTARWQNHDANRLARRGLGGAAHAARMARDAAMRSARSVQA